MQVKHGQLYHPNQDVQQIHESRQEQASGYYRTDDAGQPVYVSPQQVDQIRDQFAAYPGRMLPIDGSDFSLEDESNLPLYPSSLRTANQRQEQNQYFDDPLASSSYGAFMPPQGGPAAPGVPQKKHPVRDGIGDGIRNAFTIAAIGAAIGGLAYGAYKLNQSANRQYNNQFNNPYYYNSYSPYGTYNLNNTPYHWVRPHIRNGRAVGGYFATNPDATLLNNYSTMGNINPWTGQSGYVPLNGYGNLYPW